MWSLGNFAAADCERRECEILAGEGGGLGSALDLVAAEVDLVDALAVLERIAEGQGTGFIILVGKARCFCTSCR